MKLFWLMLIAGASASAAVAAEQAPPWASASDETGRSAANAPAQPPNASSRGAAYPSTSESPQPTESVPSRPRHEGRSAAAGASRNEEPLASTSGAAAADSRPVTSADERSSDERPWGLLGLLGLFGLLGLLRRRATGEESEVRHERYDTPHSVRS